MYNTSESSSIGIARHLKKTGILNLDQLIIFLSKAILQLIGSMQLAALSIISERQEEKSY